MKYKIGVEELKLKILGKDIYINEQISENILVQQIQDRCYCKIKNAIGHILDEAQAELNKLD